MPEDESGGGAPSVALHPVVIQYSNSEQEPDQVNMDDLPRDVRSLLI